jgi:hypothetical protein
MQQDRSLKEAINPRVAQTTEPTSAERTRHIVKILVKSLQSFAGLVYGFAVADVGFSWRWCDQCRRRGGLTEQVRGPFADHAARRLSIATHQRRHNGGVSNSQLVDTADP